MDKEEILKSIFENDPLGLLDVTPKRSAVKTADERLIASFEEINDFIEREKRLPESDIKNINEYKLHSRLKSLVDDPFKTIQLKDWDRHNLLKDIYKDQPNLRTDENRDSESNNPPLKTIESIDDIFLEDINNLLGDDPINLHTLKHIPTQEREATDFVAKRKKCKDFHKYEADFKRVQEEISRGDRKLVKFNEKQMEPGTYFVHNGILLLLEETVQLKKEKHSKVDGRTRVIFENGTESNMKFRSLGKNLFDNGYSVTANLKTAEEDFLKSFSNITKEDTEAGFIYVLRSKSTDPKISSLENLYKIGYSTTDIHTRIRGAENEPTYLMAPVEYIAGWQCYNLNPQKFEKLIHKFFGSSRLNLEITDKNGNKHTPREWFIAPIKEINQAIELIISGEVLFHGLYEEKSKSEVKCNTEHLP